MPSQLLHAVLRIEKRLAEGVFSYEDAINCYEKNRKALEASRGLSVSVYTSEVDVL